MNPEGWMGPPLGPRKVRGGGGRGSKSTGEAGDQSPGDLGNYTGKGRP